MFKSKIIGTGAYIPSNIIRNEDFLSHSFFDEKKNALNQSNSLIVEKFKQITGIKERRYADSNISSSGMGMIAAEQAILNAGIDREQLDCIIVAHNYGDISEFGAPRQMVPSVASKIKHLLGIKNVQCIPYDLIFGCPGWVQGLIQADLYIKSGEAKNCLIIGAETLSRVLDNTDRDSMIFSDGAGAVIIQATQGEGGLLSKAVQSDTREELEYIYADGSNSGEIVESKFIKMKGRKVYEYALTHVPTAMKDCLEKSGHTISDLKMVFLHQANTKMDEAIIERFFQLCGVTHLPDNIMPMNIAHLGNSSVATIPTLLHQVVNGEMQGYNLREGDLIMFASVGAGMNINAVTYKY